jgi:carbonic anhydrase
MQRLIEGIQKFQREVFPRKRELFERLAGGQQPSTLFITCADSRVSPTLFTQSEPGEIFVIRNAGNIVPAYRLPAGGVTAGIEFAVAILNVKEVVICGHTDCGAMKGLLYPEKFAHAPAVADWLNQAQATRRLVLDNYKGEDEAALVDAMIHENILVQLQNLQTHPSVLSRLAAGTLQLYGWIYDIGKGSVESFDAAQQSFVRVDGSCSHEATPVARLKRRGDLSSVT